MDEYFFLFLLLFISYANNILGRIYYKELWNKNDIYSLFVYRSIFWGFDEKVKRTLYGGSFFGI